MKVHLFGHMRFSAGLEGFGGGGSVAVTFHEIVHHVDESLIGVASGPDIRAHQGSQHGQNVGALGISYALIRLSGTRRNEPDSQPQRTGIVRCNAEIIFFEDANALAFPKLDVVLLPLRSDPSLHKQCRSPLPKTPRNPPS